MNPGYPYPFMGNAVLPMMTPVVPQAVIPQPVQQPPQPVPQQPNSAVPTVWSWKAVPDYQSMLKESVPFDGTPVLFMMQNESVFYVVTMENGRKMVNGYAFQPLDNTVQEVQQSPEEQRFSKLESSIAVIAEQLNRLVGIQNESNNEHAEQIQRKAINAE